MHRLQSLLLAVVAAIGLASTASAADMPLKAEKLAVAAPAYNWTGVYVGGLVGYGSAKGQHCDYGPPDYCEPVTNPKGWTAGATLGFNWQMSNWVLGAEADWSWARMKASAGDTNTFGCGGSCDTKLKSIGTARARVGYAVDRFLPYLTAGAGWTREEASIGNPLIVSGTTTKTSFVFGGGLEYAFAQNFSAKVEYLHFTKLGDFAYDTVSACGTPGCHVEVGAINMVRFGLNYRFMGF